MCYVLFQVAPVWGDDGAVIVTHTRGLELGVFGIVSKDVHEPVDRLTLFGGTFGLAVLTKAIHYKHIVLLRGHK